MFGFGEGEVGIVEAGSLGRCRYALVS